MLHDVVYTPDNCDYSREELGDARRLGYMDGIEFHMGSGQPGENPYDRDREIPLYCSYKQGFAEAGEDS